MPCINLLNSCGGTRSFDFDITYFYPIIVTPYFYSAYELSLEYSMTCENKDKIADKDAGASAVGGVASAVGEKVLLVV